MQRVNLTQLHRLLEHYWKYKKPFALWGRPSSGKTSALRQFAQRKAKELGLKYSEDEFGPGIFSFRVIIASQFDPVDFIGMMKLDEQKGITYFNPVASFPREGQGIVLFDEIHSADHTVIGPLCNLVLEGRLENYHMPPTFLRVAAGNRAQDFCQANELSLAFLRRLAHFEVEPELSEVLGYFIEKGRDPRVVAYLKKFPDDLFPKVWDERLLDKKANPFPYTWESAAEMIKNIKDPVLLQDLVGSWVGSECASRFVAFCKTTSKLNISKIIQNPKEELKKLQEDPERPSLFFAIVSILASMWQSRDKKLLPEKVVEILKAMLDIKAAEFATFFLDLLMRDKARRSYLTRLESFDELIIKLGYYLDGE